MNHQTRRKLVNPIDPPSEALELTPWVWIVLSLAALVGIARWIGDRDQPQTLGYLEKENPVIVRSESGTHVFPHLGIKVTLAEGWSYLSVKDDSSAIRPTFVNESNQAIVSLRQFLFQSWPPIESDVDTQQYGTTTVEWILVDHLAIGRLAKGDIDLTVMVMTHLRKAEVNDSVGEFCKGIQLITASD